MHVERERKFVIDPSKLPLLGEPERIQQWYLSFDPVVRVRARGHSQPIKIMYDVTIKLRTDTPGVSLEFEFPIDYEAASALISKEKGSTKKERYTISGWEIDHFSTGLWLAEREYAEGEDFTLPNWVTEDVTGRPEYTSFVERVNA